MTASVVASSSAACQMPAWASDSSQNTACRVLKWTKSTTKMFDINWGWLLSSHCSVFHLLLKATILHLYRVAMATSLWWSRGSTRNPLNSINYINVHRCQHQMHTVKAISKGFENWLVLLIRCSAMGLLIMPFICVAQNIDRLPFNIYFIPMLDQIS